VNSTDNNERKRRQKHVMAWGPKETHNGMTIRGSESAIRPKFFVFSELKWLLTGFKGITRVHPSDDA